MNMKESQYGPCGLYCSACGATDCGGCLSEMIDEWVRNCTFRRCTAEKNIDFCCFCEDYPCKELYAFMNDAWPHHHTMEANLAFIKEHGVEKWLASQKEHWSCPTCGAGIQWYRKTCSCGQHLDAWDVPKKF